MNSNNDIKKTNKIVKNKITKSVKKTKTVKSKTVKSKSIKEGKKKDKIVNNKIINKKNNNKNIDSNINKNNNKLFLYEYYSWIAPYKQILLNIFNNKDSNKNKYNYEKNYSIKDFNINKVFIKIYSKIIESKELKISYIETDPIKYENIKKTIAAFRSGLTYYVKNTTKINHISNAYIKIWEILRVFNFKWKKMNEFNVFHFTELPGGFINCMNDMSKKLNKKYDWKAQSLHPSLGGFGNDYNIMKKHPGKHDFGPLSTGDIIDPINIQYYYEKNLIYKPILVTSDAGIRGENIDYFLLQKLEIAQAFNVISSVIMGGDVIVKHFTPFLLSEPSSKDGFLTFIDMIYYYYMNFKIVYFYKPMASSEVSGEFYIIGLNKINNTDQNELNKLKDIISNHKINQRLFDYNISINFILQIYNFLDNLNKFNENTIRTINIVFKMNDKDIEYINNKFTIFNKIKYKTWMSEFWIN